MRFFGTPVFIAAALLLGACQGTATARKHDGSGTVDALQSHVSPNEFWMAFQSALKRRDVAEIIQMTNFPWKSDFLQLLEDNDEDRIAESARRNKVSDSERFKRYFGDLFPRAAIRSILRTSSDSLQFNKTDAHDENWSFYYGVKGRISEQDWGLYYEFSRLKDGTIRLTQIDGDG